MTDTKLTTRQIHLVETAYATFEPALEAAMRRFAIAALGPAKAKRLDPSALEDRSRRLAAAIRDTLERVGEADEAVLPDQHPGSAKIVDAIVAAIVSQGTSKLDATTQRALKIALAPVAALARAETSTQASSISSPGPAASIADVPVPCLAVDRDGRVIVWNRAAERFTGRAAADVLGKRACFAFGGMRRQTVIDRALAEGTAIAEREQLTTAAGATVRVAIESAVRFGTDGEPAGVVASFVAVASEAEEIQQQRMTRAVGGSGTAIVMIDHNLVVTYVNDATTALLRTHATTLRQAFPGFDVEALVGTCIDMFHADPQRVRAILADPSRLPHRADVRIGELVFELYVTRVTGSNGDPIGHCLEWNDVTDVRRRAELGDRLQSMVEAAQSYFMLVDNDLRITYANPSVLKMLRKYEGSLREHFRGFSVDKLVGTNIDDFHKNPGHQRRILGDASKLPYVAEIKVGELEFGVTACALFDASGRRVGSAVEWRDYNERAVYRREVQRLFEASRSGQLSVRGNLTALDDAYRPMMQHINEIIDVIVAPIGVLKAHLDRMGQGDLTAYIEEAFEGDHGLSKDAFNGTLDALNDTLGRVRAVAACVAAGSREVSDTAQALSQGATEQAASLQEISATMHGITDQTKRNAENAGVASALSTSARETAVAGDRSMRSMVGAMQEIDQASQSIRKIIKVIDDIAFQTNLLALNAAVEAARAGVHGKGFAVVAEEVRSLAGRSAKAAKETTEMIENSLAKVNQGAQIAEETAKALTEIVDGVAKVTGLVTEIAAASTEQARGIADINEGVSQIDKVTQTNTASAEQSAAASQDLSRQARELEERLGRFSLRSRSEATAGLPDGMPPELLAIIEQYLASRAANSSPEPVRAAAPKLGRRASAVIALDDDEFGKY